MNKLLYLMLMAGMLTCATVAGAQAISQDKLVAARKSFRAGQKRLAAGEYEEALFEYRIADAVVKKPSTRLGIARALVGMGRLVEAREEALSVADIPAPADEHPTLAEARKEAAALAKKLNRRIARLSLSVTPADAEVRLDKRLLPPSRYRNLPLDPGRHVIEARAKGYKVLRRSFKSKGRKRLSLELELIPLGQKGVPKREDESGIDAELIGGISLLAIGTAMFGMGVWGMTQVDAVRKNASFTSFRDHPDNANADDVCELPTAPVEVLDLCSQMKTGEVTQVVTFPLAAVATGIGVVLIVFSPTVADDDDEADTTSQLTITPVLSPQHLGASLHYTF